MLSSLFETEFDPSWYTKRYELKADMPPEEALSHYLKKGDKLGYSYNPFFNPKFVRQQLAKHSINQGPNLIETYSLNKSKISPHPLLPIVPEFFRVSEGDVRSATIAGNVSLFYLANCDSYANRPSLFFDPSVFGESVGHRPEAPFRSYLKDYLVDNVKSSVLFDPDFYSSTYPEAAKRIGAPGECAQSYIEHFILYGAFENKAPIPDFDLEYYAAEYPDVAQLLSSGGMSLVEHFIRYGIFENRNPNKFFNTKYYLEQYPEVPEEAKAFNLSGPFEHFLKLGYSRGYKANQPLFEVFVPEIHAKALYERKCRNFAVRLQQKNEKVLYKRPASKAITLSCVIPVVNQGHMTFWLLQQLANASYKLSFDVEIIVVDNGSSDITTTLTKHFPDVNYIRNENSIGYPAACNAGASQANGEIILFMNNDIELSSEALEAGVRRIKSDKSYGAVGAKIILMDGRLQEAGSVVFNDGSTRGIGRHDDPLLPEYNRTRIVDYCSGCFLFVRRSNFEEVSGFDEKFSPGYYEEADLCLRLLRKDLKTIYDPDCEVYHYEYASYSKGRPPSVSVSLMKRNQNFFFNRHAGVLLSKPSPQALDWRQDWFRSDADGTKTVAIIEDFVPDRTMGSGFVRTCDLIDSLLGLGHKVTLVASHYLAGITAEKLRAQGVEVIEGWKEPFVSHPFEGREWSFDVLWVCRTHNFAKWSRLAQQIRAKNKSVRVVFDTEAISSVREMHKFKLDGVSPRKGFDVRLDEELASHIPPDIILGVNDIDCKILKEKGLPGVHELGHCVVREKAPGVKSRSGLLFVGSFHDEASPNYDSLDWFVSRIWCALLDSIPDLYLTIVGHSGKGVDLSKIIGDKKNIQYAGRVCDLQPYFDGARFFIAPTRFAAGIPHKVHQAMASGLPVVCTDLLRSQLASEHVSFDRVPVFSAPHDDEMAMLSACVSLAKNDAAWASLQKDGWSFIEQTASPEYFYRQVRSILSELSQ